MKIIIKSKNIKITKELEEYINEKISPIEKLINLPENEEKKKTLKEIIVEVKKETKHHKKGFLLKTELRIHLPGKTIYVESVTENLNLSINEAKRELEREIKKYKNKKISVEKREGRKAKKDIKLAPESRMYRKGRIREEGL